MLTTDPAEIRKIRETPGVTEVLVTPTHVTAQGDEEAVEKLRAGPDALVGRIREASERNGSWPEATVDGVARTRRIVSAAAVLLAISLFAVVTSGVTFVRMFGFGTGLAIVVDATLVRGVLLPAAMRLTKDVAWWAPKWPRGVHRRVGISEERLSAV